MDKSAMLVYGALFGAYVGSSLTLLFRISGRLFELKLVLERIDRHLRELGGRDEVGRQRIGGGGSPWA